MAISTVRPLRSRSISVFGSATTIAKTMRGYRRATRSIRAGSRPVARFSSHPMRSSPAVGSDKNSSSLTLVLRSSKIATLRFSNARPCSVGSTPCGPRSSRRTPTTCSRSAIAFETTGCEMARCSAAFAMLPHCATARRTLSCRSLRRRLMCSARCMWALSFRKSYRDREKSNLKGMALWRNIAPSRFAGRGPMLLLRRFAPASLIASLAAFGTIEAAQAESFPSNVIRIVVPTGAGTPPDIISRVVANELSETEGWRMLVENRPGALQTIGMTEVLKQSADGYSIYPMSVPTMAVPSLMPKMGLRPQSDFVPIIKVSSSYNILVVTPSFPVKSVAELVAMLKEHPSKFNFSSAGFGKPAHLIGEMFKLQTGVSATHVPYQQSQQRIADLLNGTNQFDFLATVSAADLIATGKLRAIAVTAPKRVAGLKDVPTVVEQGFPELVVEDYVGFAVKSGTSSEIVTRLNESMNKALLRPQVREAFANLGAVPAGGTPAEFGTLIRSQVAYWGEIVKEAGIKLP